MPPNRYFSVKYLVGFCRDPYNLWFWLGSNKPLVYHKTTRVPFFHGSKCWHISQLHQWLWWDPWNFSANFFPNKKKTKNLTVSRHFPGGLGLGCLLQTCRNSVDQNLPFLLGGWGEQVQPSALGSVKERNKQILYQCDPKIFFLRKKKENASKRKKNTNKISQLRLYFFGIGAASATPVKL